MSLVKPQLITFDIFGTVMDWRTGLVAAVRRAGHWFDEAGMDKIVDAQGADEKAGYRPYREITARSLVKELDMDPAKADAIGATVGEWPFFEDSKLALWRMMKLVPCVAMTNSDRAHGEQAQKQLGFRLTHWITAEDVLVYKPDPLFWQQVSQGLSAHMTKAWWHVSAYGDYDLETTRELGLTSIFVERDHSRPGPHDHKVRNLTEVADLVESFFK